VSQEFLDHADVVVGLKEVRCEGVTEGVGIDAFGYPGLADGNFQCILKFRFMEMITPALALFG